MRNRFRFIVFFLATFVVYACANEEDEKILKLEELNSGYESKVNIWLQFLECWRDSQRKKNSNLFLQYRSLSNSEVSIELKPGLAELPRSVVDFYTSYEKLGGVYRDERRDDGIGLLSPENIQPLSKYLPELLDAKNEWSDEADDHSYFKYGVDQDDAQIRTSYQNNAIVIGQYGFSEYELIVLYHGSQTKDGEMEAALFAHASEARTPSFAEMMRQLSYYFTKSPDSIPLYSQEELKSTCAEKLQLKSVWWK